MPTTVITGANRGIGLALARAYAADGWTVHACCREPSDATELQELASAEASLNINTLEVTNADSLAGLPDALAGTPVDLLINNAGVYGPAGDSGGQDIGSLDYESWREVLDINVLGPARVTEALLDNIRRSRDGRVAVISSIMGSIAHGDGRHYAYRSSKAAANAVVKSLSVDLAKYGVAVVALHPGWVQTRMGGPSAAITPEESAAGLKEVLARPATSLNGRFFDYKGESLPW